MAAGPLALGSFDPNALMGEGVDLASRSGGDRSIMGMQHASSDKHAKIGGLLGMHQHCCRGALFLNTEQLQIHV